MHVDFGMDADSLLLLLFCKSFSIPPLCHLSPVSDRLEEAPGLTWRTHFPGVMLWDTSASSLRGLGRPDVSGGLGSGTVW